MSEPKKRRHEPGWYVGAAAFWLLAAWLTIAGLSSIIPQLFGHAGSAQAAPGACRQTLAALRDELLANTGIDVSPPATLPQREELAQFLSAWDQRLLSIRSSCTEAEQVAWDELSRLRAGMVALIDRFETEEAPRIKRLNNLLGEARGRAAEQGSTP